MFRKLVGTKYSLNLTIKLSEIEQPCSDFFFFSFFPSLYAIIINFFSPFYVSDRNVLGCLQEVDRQRGDI